MINVTMAAAEKIIESSEGLLDENGTFYLRARVVGGGCAGFSYDLYFDESGPTDADELFESNGVKLIVDQLSMQYLEGVTIDYVTEELQSGFRFDNPNAVGSCGCGSSFKV